MGLRQGETFKPRPGASSRMISLADSGETDGGKSTRRDPTGRFDLILYNGRAAALVSVDRVTGGVLIGETKSVSLVFSAGNSNVCD